MTESEKNTCPTCQGKGIVSGECECSSEWRGNKAGDDWEDCQCTPEQECSTCSGTGHVATGKKKTAG